MEETKAQKNEVTALRHYKVKIKTKLETRFSDSVLCLEGHLPYLPLRCAQKDTRNQEHGI